MKKKNMWLVVSCLMVVALLMAACAPALPEEKVSPAEEEAVTEEGKEVAPPEETESSPDCPYKVVFAQGGSKQPGFPYPTDLPEILEVSVDFGREVTLEEADTFRDQVSLVDIEGIEGILFGVATSSDTWLRSGDKTYEFEPIVTFKFHVQSRSREYTFKFQDCPWTNLGNPFLGLLVYD